MSLTVDDLPATIRATKKTLKDQASGLEEAFTQVEALMAREVEDIQERRDRNETPIPVLDHRSISSRAVTSDQVDEIRRRGVAIVRGVFSQEQATTWNEEIGEYLTANNYEEKPADPDMDQYFSQLDSSRPQIFGIYWSRPQMEARQGPALAETRAFLNTLWTHENEGTRHFEPEQECTYADRIRRREPGDRTLGLSPHVDAGSVERWIDPAYRQVYRHVFAGDWKRYDPFDGAFRAVTEEIPSAAVCSMFRTWQGWTALTPQGEGDGTLQVLPIARAVVYMLLRALRDDVPPEELCGAEPGRALSVNDEWHSLLMPAFVPIPLVEPGDTVWWHPDIGHAVEDVNGGTGYSNVVYIGSAPACPKNTAYLQRQKAAFLRGESAPDFAPENYEVTFDGRATVEDLTPLGRKQMGVDPW